MLMQKTRIRTYKQMTKREILADSLLLLTALIWGCAFAVVKNALDSFPPGAIIAMRYLIAAAITGILFRRHLKELTRGDVARGALVGLLLFGAYIVQTTGLQYTTAGKNAFLTTVYVLLVPFGCALLFHQKLQKSNLIAAVMMLVGIGLLSLDGQGGGLNPGDILTLICGFLFAGHIIAVEQCQKKTNTYALIVLQFAFCALYAGLYNRIFERGMPLAFTPGSIGGLLYIAVFSTTIGMSACKTSARAWPPLRTQSFCFRWNRCSACCFPACCWAKRSRCKWASALRSSLPRCWSANLRRGKKIDARIRFGIINLKKPSLFFKARIFHLPTGRVYAILLIRAVRQMNRSPCRSRRGSLRCRAYWWHPLCRSRRGRRFLRPAWHRASLQT